MAQRTLAELCTTLETSIASAIAEVRGHESRAASQVSWGSVTARPNGLLQQIQNLTIELRALGTDFDEERASIPSLLWSRTKLVVGHCNTQAEALGDGFKDADDDMERAEVAREASRPLETSKRALQLARDGLEMAKALQVAQRDDSPPYGAMQILQEIGSLRNWRANISGLDEPVDAAAVADIMDFVNQLEQYAEQASGSRVPPNVAAMALNNISTSPHDPNPLTESPAYLLRRNAPSIRLQHLAKVGIGKKEPWGVVFVNRQRPTVAVTTFIGDISFFEARKGTAMGSCPATGIAMCFSPNGQLVAVLTELDQSDIGRAGEVAIYHDGVTFHKPALVVYDTQAQARRLQIRGHGIRPLAFSPDGRRLAVSAPRGQIRLVDVSHPHFNSTAREPDLCIAAHTDEVTAAVFAPGGGALVSMSRDGTVRVTDPVSLRSLGKLEVDTWRNPLCLAVAPGGAVVVAVWGSSVTLWNTETGVLGGYNLASVRERDGTPVAVSPDCRWLACRTDDGHDISDLATGEVLFTCRFVAGGGFASDAAFSPDGRFLAVTKFMPGKSGATSGGGVAALGMANLDTWEVVVEERQ